MCVQFGHLFASVVADTTLDLSRPIIAKGRRSKRDRAARQNIVSFIQPSESDNISTTSAELESEADTDNDDDNEGTTELGITSVDPTLLDAGDDWAVRVERLSQGLDNLVRTLRKRVESVVGEGGPSASAFGMLDFALEDWDL
jgi:gamma-tubulin complex component 5